MTEHLVWLGRIALGTALGGLIGYERDHADKPVGLRTHLLVAMAASTFMVVSANFSHFQEVRPGETLITLDRARIAGSVVTGIGFLAGGAILRWGHSVHGLTTAAGLWLVTAIGLASGGGMYFEAVSVTALGLVTLTFVRRIEDKGRLHVRRKVTVTVTGGPSRIQAIEQALSEIGASITDIDYDRHLDGEPRVAVSFDAHHPSSLTLRALAERLEQIPGLRDAHVERTD